jgi:tetratricopeptide (TPR) repeat protein
MHAITKNSRNALALCGLVATLFAAPTYADDTADISKLMHAGQFAEALTRADSALSQRPRDPQLRFLKGLILTEQNKTPEAIAAFTKLTEDFPDLPEPYNNLAVLFASAGQYDKARAALDMAIRTNPTYATAHENLGDIYAKLASQAYDKALQIDSGNNGARSKLTLVRTLTGNTSNSTAAAPKIAAVAATTAPVPPARVAAPAVPAPAASRAPVIAARTATPAPTVPAPLAKASSAPAQAVPAPSVADTASSGTKPEAVTGGREEVLEALNRWAKAWSDQDMKNYLASYGDDFKTPSGASRKVWEAERRARIEGKSRITVKIDSPQVSISSDTATVRFRQTYLSDRLNNIAAKTIVFSKQDGKWMIQQEKSGG